MDHRKDKMIFARDGEPLAPRHADRAAAPSGLEERIDCAEDHDFDIVFEFEDSAHGAN